MAKEKTLPKHMQPEGQREAQAMKDKAIRAWASDRGLGTRPQTFAEVVRAPLKSDKNIKR